MFARVLVTLLGLAAGVVIVTLVLVAAPVAWWWQLHSCVWPGCRPVPATGATLDRAATRPRSTISSAR